MKKTEGIKLRFKKMRIWISGLAIITTGLFFCIPCCNYWYELKAKTCTFTSEVRLFQSKSENFECQFQMLKPGDIIFTHRKGYLSNIFIPGYFKHAALYLGTASDIAEHMPNPIGLKHESGVAKGLVIEALNDGVCIRPASKALDANGLLVLRPIVCDRIRLVAVERALAMIHSPYDFNFDFNSADKIACSELIWRSYSEESLFEIHKLLGRSFTTPDEMVRDFLADSRAGNKRFEIILFTK